LEILLTNTSGSWISYDYPPIISFIPYEGVSRVRIIGLIKTPP
jgi:hypothetical protein